MEAAPLDVAVDADVDTDGAAEAHDAGLRAAEKVSFRPVHVKSRICLGGGWLPAPQWFEQTPAQGGSGMYATLKCESTTLRHFLGVKATGPRYRPLSSFISVMRKAINDKKESEKAAASLPTGKRIRRNNRATRCLLESLPQSMLVTIPAAQMGGGGDWEFRAILPGHTQHAPTMEATAANFKRFFVAAGGREACAPDQLRSAPMPDGRRGKKKRKNMEEARCVRLCDGSRPSSGKARFTCRVPVDTPEKKRKQSVMGLSPLNTRRRRDRLRANVYSFTRSNLEDRSPQTILDKLGAKRAAIAGKRAAVTAAREALREARQNDAFADKTDCGDESADDGASAPCTPVGATTSAASGQSPAAWSNDSPGAV